MKTELAEIDVGVEFWHLAETDSVPDWSEITVDLERVDGLAGELLAAIPDPDLRIVAFASWPAIARAAVLAVFFISLFAAGMFAGREYERADRAVKVAQTAEGSAE